MGAGLWEVTHLQGVKSLCWAELWPVGVTLSLALFRIRFLKATSGLLRSMSLPVGFLSVLVGVCLCVPNWPCFSRNYFRVHLPVCPTHAKKNLLIHRSKFVSFFFLFWHRILTPASRFHRRLIFKICGMFLKFKILVFCTSRRSIWASLEWLCRSQSFWSYDTLPQLSLFWLFKKFYAFRKPLMWMFAHGVCVLKKQSF